MIEPKKEIAIFVSHRIDLSYDTPNNSIYHPLRCGAVYDTNSSLIPGDNTGDNISSKRLSFCELTVQYWAWKNYNADYYGLCHYRRYFSFSDNIFPQTRLNVLEENNILNVEKKYCLSDTTKIRSDIESCDALVPYGIDVRTILTGVPGKERFYPHTVKEFWNEKRDQIDPLCVDKLIEIVRHSKPEFYDYLIKYLNGNTIYAGCCYVMKKQLFNQLCEFQFTILKFLLEQFDMSNYTGEKIRQPAFMGEILYGAFIVYLKETGKKVLEHQVVLFKDAQKEKPTNKTSPKIVRPIKTRFNRIVKKILRHVSPAYRVALRIERKIDNGDKIVPKKNYASSLSKTLWDSWTLTSNINLYTSCLAQEIHDTHMASFREFKGINAGKDVVIVATGPSMRYYTQMPQAIHIGVNSAFKNPKIQLDYYFTTDFESRNEWFFELKNYNFIKFFGQYSAGKYRDRFQVPEKIIEENHGRRFFQGAPNEDIFINIEYYPLMAFYSITFQALHFAIYTNPKRIFLVGCDCSSEGYFDGGKQLFANPPKWLKGYIKFKDFINRFYPDTEIISVNPVGLKGLFRDVYTEDYLLEHSESITSPCETLDHIIHEG